MLDQQHCLQTKKTRKRCGVEESLLIASATTLQQYGIVARQLLIDNLIVPDVKGEPTAGSREMALDDDS